MILSFIFSRINCRVKTEATVSEVIVKSTFWRGKTISFYTPVLTYTVNGCEYSDKADISVRNEKRFAVGQKVCVFVDKNRPNVFRYGGNAGIVAVGLVIFAIGIFMIVCYFV